MRNTRVVDIVRTLKEYDLDIVIHDPWANAEVARREYGAEVSNALPRERFDAVILAVAHKAFETLDVAALRKPASVLFDVKGFLPADQVDGRL